MRPNNEYYQVQPTTVYQPPTVGYNQFGTNWISQPPTYTSQSPLDHAFPYNTNPVQYRSSAPNLRTNIPFQTQTYGFPLQRERLKSFGPQFRYHPRTQVYSQLEQPRVLPVQRRHRAPLSPPNMTRRDEISTKGTSIRMWGRSSPREQEVTHPEFFGGHQDLQGLRGFSNKYQNPQIASKVFNPKYGMFDSPNLGEINQEPLNKALNFENHPFKPMSTQQTVAAPAPRSRGRFGGFFKSRPKLSQQQLYPARRPKPPWTKGSAGEIFPDTRLEVAAVNARRRAARVQYERPVSRIMGIDEEGLRWV